MREMPYQEVARLVLVVVSVTESGKEQLCSSASTALVVGAVGMENYTQVSWPDSEDVKLPRWE